MNNNPFYTVCGIVEIGGKVLLVRHTYGRICDFYGVIIQFNPLFRGRKRSIVRSEFCTIER